MKTLLTLTLLGTLSLTACNHTEHSQTTTITRSISTPQPAAATPAQTQPAQSTSTVALKSLQTPFITKAREIGMYAWNIVPAGDGPEDERIKLSWYFRNANGSKSGDNSCTLSRKTWAHVGGIHVWIPASSSTSLTSTDDRATICVDIRKSGEVGIYSASSNLPNPFKNAGSPLYFYDNTPQQTPGQLVLLATHKEDRPLKDSPALIISAEITQ